MRTDTCPPAESGGASTSGFKDVIIAGPAPAPLLKAETYYRYQIMLRTRSMSKLSHALAKMVAALTLPDEVTMAVDIDPVNLFERMRGAYRWERRV